MTNRMTSQKQSEANRRNAQLSTGPSSAAGKKRSRTNALSHGLRAEQCIMPGESEKEAKRFRDDIVFGFSPANIVEEQLAERIAWLFWRLRRVPAFEQALYRAAVTGALDADPSNDWPKSNDQIKRGFEMILGSDIGKLLLSGAIDKLNRYEMSLARQLQDTRKHLAILQEERRKERETECRTVELTANEEPQVESRNSHQGNPPSTVDPSTVAEILERLKKMNEHQRSSIVGSSE